MKHRLTAASALLISTALLATACGGSGSTSSGSGSGTITLWARDGKKASPASSPKPGASPPAPKGGGASATPAVGVPTAAPVREDRSHPGLGSRSPVSGRPPGGSAGPRRRPLASSSVCCCRRTTAEDSSAAPSSRPRPSGQTLEQECAEAVPSPRTGGGISADDQRISHRPGFQLGLLRRSCGAAGKVGCRAESPRCRHH
jgi:hypothetical protein